MTYARLIPGSAEVILARYIMTRPASIRSYDVPLSRTSFRYVTARAGLRKVTISSREVIYLITDEAELWAWDVVSRDEHRPSPAEYRRIKRDHALRRKLSRLLPTPTQP